jgi:hypothetical protein
MGSGFLGRFEEIERKMGEMLKETERANAARDSKAELRGVTPPPTIYSLGLSKRESAAVVRAMAGSNR